jgi:AcrR family transcriptional regulator
MVGNATQHRRGARPSPTRERRPAKAGPGRPQDEALDAAILGAALTLVAEVGYERMSIEEVARRASTAKTSVYRRWPTKGAMVLAAVRYYIRDPSGGEARAAADDTGSLRGDLLAHAKRLASLLTRERVSILAGLLLAMRTQPELAETVKGQIVQLEGSAVASILERAAARGERAAVRPAATLAMVLPSVLFTRMLVLDASLDDAFLRRLVDEVLVPAFRHT